MAVRWADGKGGLGVTADRLETTRLFLRWFTFDDLDAYYELGSNPLVIRYVGNRPFASREAARETLARAPLNDYATYGFGRFACVWKETGDVVGFCGPKFLPDTQDIDLGYRFLPNFWGIGLATESSLAVLAYAQHTLNLKRLVAWVHPDNAVSARVLAKLGFSFERKASVPDLPDVAMDFYDKRLYG
jgi:RimJ/RimL family protein N-acetyltransferase